LLITLYKVGGFKCLARRIKSETVNLVSYNLSKMSRELCLQALQIFNILSILSGIITIVVGSFSIPQTVVNNGNVYVGTAEQYNTDLYNAQIGSNGFKVVMIGLGVVIYGFSGCFGALYCHNKYGIEAPMIQRHVRINPEPTVIEIPSNSVVKNNENNIRKWTGGLVF
jgi:hypothetical protein